MLALNLVSQGRVNAGLYYGVEIPVVDYGPLWRVAVLFWDEHHIAGYP